MSVGRFSAVAGGMAAATVAADLAVLKLANEDSEHLWAKHSFWTGALVGTTVLESFNALRKPSQHGPIAVGMIVGDVIALTASAALDLGEH